VSSDTQLQAEILLDIDSGVWRMSTLAAHPGLGRQDKALMSPTVTYRFDLFDDTGSRNCLFIAQCFGDEHAVLLARALFDSAFVRMKSIKVWREDVLVHEAKKSKESPVN
jgi:hypothetical protein